MAGAEKLDITASSDDEGIRLLLDGELDVATAPLLVAAVATGKERYRRVLLDLSALSFLDSTGLAALMHLVSESRGDQCSLVVAAGFQPPVQRVLEITGVLTALPIVRE